MGTSSLYGQRFLLYDKALCAGAEGLVEEACSSAVRRRVRQPVKVPPSSTPDGARARATGHIAPAPRAHPLAGILDHTWDGTVALAEGSKN